MGQLFRRVGDGCVATFTPEEATVLRRVATDVRALVAGDVTAPEGDPVVQRLFPDAYRDDPAEADEFRRLTEGELRAGKIDDTDALLRTLPEDGGEVRLSDDDTDAWLRALNDVRLTLGTRLDVTDDTDLQAEIDEADARGNDGPRLAYLCVYAFLSYLQESLLGALAGER